MKTFSLIKVALFTLVFIGQVAHSESGLSPKKAFNPIANRTRPHLDHSAYFKNDIKNPQEVTRACLSCHKNAAKEVMKTAHWSWLSGDVERNGKIVRTGKMNLLNNYCIGVSGNWASCTKCHAGYGWKDKTYNFAVAENVDCLICHDGSGLYTKGKEGMPSPNVNLAAVARSVRAPMRENCGTCHFNGGGGMGVKHGDLDDSLLNPSEQMDVHMGKLNFQCIDCHKTNAHYIPGKLNATYSSATHAERFDCAKCHTEEPHKDRRLNQHVARIACQTCHIPSFARKYPTKMEWDWSTAGNKNKKENPHEYLKIKGSFKYENNVLPEYAWFNGKMKRYVTGDKITSPKDQGLNEPNGSLNDQSSKIWPFKIHRGKQVFDPKNNIIIPPITSGEGGYWSKFDWDFAVRKGAETAGLPFSGQYAFIQTHMYTPITHMVAPANKSLSCVDCHSKNGRLNWKALGYKKDPAKGAINGK